MRVRSLFLHAPVSSVVLVVMTGGVDTVTVIGYTALKQDPVVDVAVTL